MVTASRVLDEMLHELKAAQERFQDSLGHAWREATALRVRMPSTDQTIEVEISGDFQLVSVDIDAEAYRQHTAASLCAAIMSAYQRAVFELSRRQHRAILRTVAPIEEEPT